MKALGIEPAAPTLRTLGFRFPAGSIGEYCGSVAAYLLDRRFTDAWEALPIWRHDGLNYTRPHYESLAGALRALTNQPVALLPSSSLAPAQRTRGVTAVLLTTEPFGPELPRAVQAWERAVRRGRNSVTLAPWLPETPERWWPGEHLDKGGTADPTIPSWAREALAWNLSARLAGHLLDLGTPGRPRPCELLADTDGAVMLWEPLRENETASAVRVSPRLWHLPGATGPAMVFDARLVRLHDQWPGTRHAWIRAAGAGKNRVLRVRVRPFRSGKASPWQEVPADHVPELLEACGHEQIVLPEDFSTRDCGVRAISGHADVHVPPAWLRRRLHATLVAALPGFDELTARPVRPRGRPATAADPPGEPHHARLTPRRSLHVLCIHSTTAARTRMLSHLGALAQSEPLDVPDGVTTELGDGMRVTVHRMPELLRHGLHDRSAVLAGLGSLRADEDATTIAWLETAWHANSRPPQRQDARPILRQLLGRHGVPVFFLHSAPALSISDSVGTRGELWQEDRAAVTSLLHRMGALGTPSSRTGAPDDDRYLATLVGIRTSRHRLGANRSAPPILTMVAVPPHTLTSWAQHAQMYRWPAGWTDYPTALADYHAGPIAPPFAVAGEQLASSIRSRVEDALRRLGAQRLIIFVDAKVNRHIWAGLGEARFGRADLPGDSLTEASQIAVVRCNAEPAVPQPVFPESTDSGIGVAPVLGGGLHRFAGATADVWYRPGTGTSGQTGTSVEIAVARAGSWDTDDLAGLAAYHLAAGWGPLGLAAAADQEHPHYAGDHYDDEVTS